MTLQLLLTITAYVITAGICWCLGYNWGLANGKKQLNVKEFLAYKWGYKDGKADAKKYKGTYLDDTFNVTGQADHQEE